MSNAKFNRHEVPRPGKTSRQENQKIIKEGVDEMERETLLKEMDLGQINKDLIQILRSHTFSTITAAQEKKDGSTTPEVRVDSSEGNLDSQHNIFVQFCKKLHEYIEAHDVLSKVLNLGRIVEDCRMSADATGTVLDKDDVSQVSFTQRRINVMYSKLVQAVNEHAA